jgi:hypothetical protein
MLLFSYGTLQLEKVQLKLFGRLVETSEDALPGFTPTTVVIADPDVLSTSGMATHLAAIPSDDPAAAMPGKALHITEADLAEVDRYEGDEYKRIEVRLVSGRDAWVYVKA